MMLAEMFEAIYVFKVENYGLLQMMIFTWNS